MASLVVAVLILAVSGRSAATWCVCKDGLGDAVLQKTLDYACGAGADCNPIKQNGICFQPNSVRSHCSYAVNSYFQRKGQAAGACDFAGTAAVSSSDPSGSGCVFPASATPSTTPTTPVTTTPTTSTPISTTPTTSSPVTTTPTTSTPITTTPGTSTTPTPTTTTTASPFTATPTGVLGAGMAPTGINNDMSHGGLRLLGDKLQLAVSFLVSWLVLALVQHSLN